jgi:putative endonuclease
MSTYESNQLFFPEWDKSAISNQQSAISIQHSAKRRCSGEPECRDLLLHAYVRSVTAPLHRTGHAINMPRSQRTYYVYILASKSRVLYVGITSRLISRLGEHRSGELGGFTSDYRLHRLVYFECFDWADAAIRREKQLKRWRRENKIALIGRRNPTWEDLSAEWGKPVSLQLRTVENSRSLHSD